MNNMSFATGISTTIPVVISQLSLQVAFAKGLGWVCEDRSFVGEILAAIRRRFRNSKRHKKDIRARFRIGL